MYKKTLRLLLLIMVYIISSPSGSLYAQDWNRDHSIGTVNGIYSYSYNQAPAQLVEVFPPVIPNTGISYIWESCQTPAGTFATAAGAATGSSYTFSGPLTQTMYYRRKTIYTANGTFIYSNIIKISVVSVNWEDINYVREHDVLTTGMTSWTAVDQLAIGPKLQMTTYLDGLGRPLQRVSRETATPSSGTLWGDRVQFSVYDQMGRESQNYLPYTTTSQTGKFKTAPVTDQATYYSATYSETSSFSQISFDNSPLNRITNLKEPGTAWAASAGNSAGYDVNTLADNVQIWDVDYVQGNPPVNKGAYPANTLYKLSYTDVNGKAVVEYSNKSGQLILKKIQIDDAPTNGHTGWICTYNVYDDFGLLRFQIQPEAVKFLEPNGWSFAGTNGTQVLNELCFQYNYDDKGRIIWKKAPGVDPLNMIYDERGRIVFMQDGNQAALTTPQWTANLYDELDRPVITTLYNTTKTISTLQSDITGSATTTSSTVTNAAQPVTDLVVNSRQTTIPRYAARHSVELVSDANGNFESLAGDVYTVEIDPTATQAAVVTTTTYKNPITTTDLNNGAVCTILKYVFYDNYSFTNVKPFATGSTNTDAYSAADPDVTPLAPSLRVTSMSTGSMGRVLGSNLFLSTSNYYDEKGQEIQTIKDNIKSGVDITTLQYHFDGRILSSCNAHTTAGTGYTGFTTLTKFIFDKIGRTTSIQKTYGNNAPKIVASYDYDDFGRVKSKHFDPGYNNLVTGLSELESLNYNFNIHNQITGINKDYALKTGVYNKWSHYFGMYLGFDNRDNVFTKAELNGQVTGTLWNSMGDDAQRRYNYGYDNAGRLTNSDYTEQGHPGDGWANNKMDFSINGTSGKMTYDLNGNLLTMLQKGVMPGTASPITIDDLRYSYTSGSLLYSNKLQSVTDQMTTTSANGLSGDFKDGTNGTTPDYVYDNNGNSVIDLNKNVQSVNGGATGTKGIIYNYLDKPELIRVVGRGTVRIVYSADGEKLQRTFIPEAGGTSVITSYINEYVYTETGTVTTSTPAPLGGGTPVLSYINFEEGRIRVMTPVAQSNSYGDALTENGNITLPNGKSGAFDYFVMDYQKNVRMILTEEVHSATNVCTMESARATAEEPIFGQTGGGNEVAGTRYATAGTGWTGNTSTSVSRLGNLSGKNIGPNTLQKVMAGDLVSATADYYYPTPTGGDNAGIVTTVLNSLVQAITGGSAATNLVKAGVTGINSTLNGLPGFISAVKPTGAGSTPLAYLTILFFDERFNLVSVSDGGLAQAQVSPTITAAGLSFAPLLIKAPKNGYMFAYVSNRSDQNVYFDNFKVSITAGNITEENHYYSYGLKIAAISSRKLPDVNEGDIKNNSLYNDKELWDEGDLNWYDYGFRNYDPQIGRFPQLDPLSDAYALLTPYQYASNDPITNIDVDGLEGFNSVGIGANLMSDGIPITNKFLLSLTRAASATSTVSRGFGAFNLITSITSILISSCEVTSGILNGNITTNSIIDPTLSLITLRGSADALLSAQTWGWSELWGTHLKEYKDPQQQKAYLIGRIVGDAAAAAQGAHEITIGGGTALASGAETGGIGVLVGGGIAVHGAMMELTAAKDVIWLTQKLKELHVSAVDIVKYKQPQSGPEPNGGKSNGDHGGPEHNSAIDNRVSNLQKDPNIKDIRKNQVQVDVNGNRVGNNRPDIQYKMYDPKTKTWKQHIIEYDNNPTNSANHGNEIRKNDPKAAVELNLLK